MILKVFVKRSCALLGVDGGLCWKSSPNRFTVFNAVQATTATVFQVLMQATIFNECSMLHVSSQSAAFQGQLNQTV